MCSFLTVSPAAWRCTTAKRSSHWSHAHALCTSIQENEYTFQCLLYSRLLFFLICTEFPFLIFFFFKHYLSPKHLIALLLLSSDSQRIFHFLITVSELFTHLHNIYISSLNFCIIPIIFSLRTDYSEDV